MRVGPRTAVGTPPGAVSRVRDGRSCPDKPNQEQTEAKRAAMIALGYVRRSKESAARTVSLEDQRTRIEAYCQEREWSLAEVVVDDGVSGGRRERLERLAERVKATGARAIVVYHLDRFARDLAATLDYLRRFARRGVELHVVGRGRVEADTASGFIVTAVEGLAAEHYRRVISEKTRDALARLRAKGRRVSRFAPYGYRLAPGGGLLVSSKEQVLLGHIRVLQGQGLSLRAISRYLASRGSLARNGRPFGPSTLLGIVRKRTLTNTSELS
jgi:DNA invertase Pin-like site-specific DNA recombinase